MKRVLKSPSFAATTASAKALFTSGMHPEGTRYGGFEVNEAKRLRALEDENSKLKKLLAESHLDIAALKDVLSKKW